MRVRSDRRREVLDRGDDCRVIQLHPGDRDEDGRTDPVGVVEQVSAGHRLARHTRVTGPEPAEQRLVAEAAESRSEGEGGEDDPEGHRGPGVLADEQPQPAQEGGADAGRERADV